MSQNSNRAPSLLLFCIWPQEKLSRFNEQVTLSRQESNVHLFQRGSFSNQLIRNVPPKMIKKWLSFGPVVKHLSKKPRAQRKNRRHMQHDRPPTFSFNMTIFKQTHIVTQSLRRIL